VRIPLPLLLPLLELRLGLLLGLRLELLPELNVRLPLEELWLPPELELCDDDEE